MSSSDLKENSYVRDALGQFHGIFLKYDCQVMVIIGSLYIIIIAMRMSVAFIECPRSSSLKCLQT